MTATMIRLMGETDIVDIDPSSHDGTAHPLLMGLDAADRMNLLGHWLDQDRGEALADDADHRLAMTAIANAYLADQSAVALGDDANFVILTVLREKWPVGSKARFQSVADRVGAQHTYLAHLCAPSKVDDFGDETALKQSETTQLMLALPTFKRNRKQFANSSAVQTLIRQSG